MTCVRFLLVLGISLLLAACGGKTRHVFPPDASVQQLRVADNGEWKLTLRLHNYSFEALIHFDRIEAKLEVDGKPAGDISSVIDIEVPGLSADVVEVSLTPSPAATQALASGTAHPVSYKLAGTIHATPEKQGSRTYPVEHEGWLSPVPGVPGTYR